MKKLFIGILLVFIIFSLQQIVTKKGIDNVLGQMMHHHGGGPEIENDMVLIPGGEFIMGSTSAEVEETIKAFGKKETFNKEACRMESPQKKATIKPFYIDRYEVTNAEYRKFILATGHQPPSNWSGADYPIDKANFPAVMIAYKDTEAYAKWS